MKAVIKPGYDAQRIPLKEVVPLDTPFTLFISPSQLCNFRCNFCAQSLSKAQKQAKGLVSLNQDFKLLLKIAEQSKSFPHKYKRILLTGLGEPLMNQHLVEMVRTLNDYEVAENLEIFTNGSLLTPTLSEELVEAGLTRLRISVQGTDSRQYKKFSGIDLDFEKYVEGLKYFYGVSRGKCSISIKIIEEELKDADDRQKFFDIFGAVSDDIFVENLVRAQPAMGDYGEKISQTRTFYGEPTRLRAVCPYIFYTLQTDSQGNCYPCPPLSLPRSFSLGNLNEESLSEIWNGPKRRALMLSHLRQDGSKGDLCQQCICYQAFTPEEDNLDEVSAEVIRRLGEHTCPT